MLAQHAESSIGWGDENFLTCAVCLFGVFFSKNLILSFVGKFSPAQKVLYEAVLRVQEACLKMCTMQFSLDDIYREMILMLGRELQTLGIIPQNISNLELSGVSHCLKS